MFKWTNLLQSSAKKNAKMTHAAHAIFQTLRYSPKHPHIFCWFRSILVFLHLLCYYSTGITQFFKWRLAFHNALHGMCNCCCCICWRPNDGRISKCAIQFFALPLLFFSLTLVLFFTKLLIQMDNKIDDSAFNVDFECTRNCCVEIKQKKTRPIRIHRERKPSEK